MPDTPTTPAPTPSLSVQIIHVSYLDEGSAVVNGRLWLWEISHGGWGGPTFLRKDGVRLLRQPSEKNPVWNAYEDWFRKYKRNRQRRLARAKKRAALKTEAR